MLSRDLTEELHRALVCVCGHLVALYGGFSSPSDALASMDVSFAEKRSEPGDLLLLTGEGGTGKSRVISAVQYFARGWNRSTSVMVMAVTGVAEAAFGASTVHAGLGINPAINVLQCN